MRAPRVLLRLVWVYHRFLDRITGGRFDTSRYGDPTLWLTTVGRRSGERRENALTYLTVGPDLVVVASNAGHDDDPAWWLNLRAAPDTTVRLPGPEPRAVRAREAQGSERADLWARFVGHYPGYRRYEHQTSRQIPVVVLEPRSGT